MADYSIVRRIELQPVKGWADCVIVRPGAFRAEPLKEGRAQMGMALGVAGLYMETPAHRVLANFCGRQWFEMKEFFGHLVREGRVRGIGDIQRAMMFFNIAADEAKWGERMELIHRELGSSISVPRTRMIWGEMDAFKLSNEMRELGCGMEFIAVGTGGHVIFDMAGGMYRVDGNWMPIRETSPSGIGRQEQLMQRMVMVSGLTCLDCGKMATGPMKGREVEAAA